MHDGIKCDNNHCWMEGHCSTIPDFDLKLEFSLMDKNSTVQTIAVPQNRLFKRGTSLGDSDDNCHLVVRPETKELKDAATVMIGTMHLEYYYLVLGSRESTEDSPLFGDA